MRGIDGINPPEAILNRSDGASLACFSWVETKPRKARRLR